MKNQLTLEELQQLVDEEIEKRGGRVTDPKQDYVCWKCSATTKAEPHDADGSETTGMMWPSYCYECCRLGDDLVPIRIEAFKERFPGVKFSVGPESVMALQNQAAYRMMARRGWVFGKSQGEA